MIISEHRTELPCTAKEECGFAEKLRITVMSLVDIGVDVRTEILRGNKLIGERMRLFTRLVGTTACVAALALLIGNATARECEADDEGRCTTSAREAVSVQIDVGHSGVTSFKTALRFPLTEAWQHTFNGVVSYPLIANDRVFVTVGGNLQAFGSTLFALNSQTGAILWSQVIEGGYYYWSAAAYESGQVFVLNGNGLLRAFDERTGSLNWSVQVPNEYLVNSPPVAKDGVVYVQGDGSNSLTAFRADTGEPIWVQSIEPGAFGSPALSSEGIFTSSDCHVYAFNRISGVPLWKLAGDCLGGIGYLVYRNGVLYVSDPFGSGNRIIDATSGIVLGTFDANAFETNAGLPIVGKERAYYLANGVVEAFSVPEQNHLWSFAGDSGLITQSPVQVNSIVFVGSDSGMLWGLDDRTGKIVWSTNVGSSISARVCCASPTTSLAAGDEILVVPADFTLTAFRSGFADPPRDFPAPDPHD